MGRKLWSFIEKAANTFLVTVFKMLKREVDEKEFTTLIQFLKFGIIGLSNTIISYTIYLLFLILLKKININKDYLLAQLISFLLSVLWSFYWNDNKVFTIKKECPLWKRLLKTYVAYSVTGLFLNTVLLILWVQVFHVSKLIAPVINLVVTVPLNFLINKFWAFK